MAAVLAASALDTSDRAVAQTVAGVRVRVDVTKQWLREERSSPGPVLVGPQAAIELEWRILNSSGGIIEIPSPDAFLLLRVARLGRAVAVHTQSAREMTPRTRANAEVTSTTVSAWGRWSDSLPLASTYGELGRHREATVVYRRLLPELIRALESPLGGTLRDARHLRRAAMSFAAVGDLAEAAKLLRIEGRTPEARRRRAVAAVRAEGWGESAIGERPVRRIWEAAPAIR